MLGEKAIKDGIWVDDAGNIVLPAMVRAPGANGYYYFAPLHAVTVSAGGTLVLDARDVRAALSSVNKQMKQEGTKAARLSRRRRASLG